MSGTGDEVDLRYGSILRVRRVDEESGQVWFDRRDGASGWFPRSLVDEVEAGQILYVPDETTEADRVRLLSEEDWLIRGGDVATVSLISEDGSTAVLDLNGRHQTFAQRNPAPFVKGQTIAVDASGIQSSWSPVKLADVFVRFLPEVGDQTRQLPHLFDNAGSGADRVGAMPVSEVLRDKGLVPFGRDLARLASRDVPEDLVLRAATDAARSISTLEELQDVGMLRGAFEEVVRAVDTAPSITGTTETARIDRDLVRTLRELHQTVAQVRDDARPQDRGSCSRTYGPPWQPGLHRHSQRQGRQSVGSRAST